MFKKILFPTDFSDVAIKALQYIKQLREAGGQEVVLLHVINQRIIDGLMRHAIQNNDIDLWKKRAAEVAQESLAEMGKELESAGYKVKIFIKTGFPWRKVLELEEAEAPSILVIGSHGRSNVSDMFLGSVSDRVIRKCKRPVMVIKRETEA
jgi:nucleotide-binding universal stress UspA family protein